MMKYAAGIIVALVLLYLLGTGLMQVLVAVGMGLVAYGLTDKFTKKDAGDGGL
ncbi:MAG: hypothetical protein H6918_08065 [Sphingomonadaceae bacterium]|nr:hypothetical protein [Sphingomonadaceae bacterium]